MKTDLESRVIDLAADELGIDAESIFPGTRIEDLFTDSLEYMSFIVRLKDIGEITDGQISNAETIGDLIDALAIPN